MKHKHSELIKLWADGIEIEQAETELSRWEPFDGFWDASYHYRQKPEPELELFDPIAELQIAQGWTDTEAAHCYADDVLCNLLISIGYIEVVEEYNKINKWYA